jgi:hypothetical protein
VVFWKRTTLSKYQPLLLRALDEIVEEQFQAGIALLHSTAHVLVRFDLAPQLGITAVVLGGSLDCLVNLHNKQEK